MKLGDRVKKKGGVVVGVVLTVRELWVTVDWSANHYRDVEAHHRDELEVIDVVTQLGDLA